MRSFYLLIGVIVVLFGCKKDDGDLVVPAPVYSLSDLPTEYKPIQNGSAITGRLKSEIHIGQLSGEWRYNQQGNLLEGRRFRSGELMSADQYYYDATGLLRFIQHFESPCVYASTYLCSAPVKWSSYDEVDVDNANHILESRTFLNKSGQWELRSITNHVYDQNGRPTKLLRYSADRKLASTQEFTYDGEGNIIKMREINTNTTPDLADRTYQYTYDKALNPYIGTIHYVSPYFVSRNIQSSPGTTYEYTTKGYPARIHFNNVVTELTYY
ncbi:hypothetical protein IC229_20410 [Spirosoma sp. BT702]|uniref:YD repeat-containing protein n=1 Tax=Spirosoma profusum TaxID=2771354 RepID=A0A926XZA4_9BACT|nr:hypothetical protein [Spirosoma profusum]MBD2703021.1 hypothetical protein [Spirosoma profusum]